MPKAVGFLLCVFEDRQNSNARIAYTMPGSLLSLVGFPSVIRKGLPMSLLVQDVMCEERATCRNGSFFFVKLKTRGPSE